MTKNEKAIINQLLLFVSAYEGKSESLPKLRNFLKMKKELPVILYRKSFHGVEMKGFDIMTKKDNSEAYEEERQAIAFLKNCIEDREI